MRKRPVIDRLLDRIEIDENGCWLWTGPVTRDGYGMIGVEGNRSRGIHRVAYEHFVGPIPIGLQIDHLCRVRHCCCPWHLEAVTSGENTRRGDTGKHLVSAQLSKTHCAQGHPFDEENTRRWRDWRKC